MGDCGMVCGVGLGAGHTVPASPKARHGCVAGQGAGCLAGSWGDGLHSSGLGIKHPFVCALWIYWFLPSLHC